MPFLILVVLLIFIPPLSCISCPWRASTLPRVTRIIRILFFINLDLIATIYSIMEESSKTESRTSKLLKLLLKILVTAVCRWYVSRKIDFQKAGAALAHANWFYLFPALIAFAISKWISAIRLNIYFRNINIRFSEWKNVRLYWLGMFYNLFLPGSISGDAYKVILLRR